MENSLTKTRIELLLLFVLYMFILPRVYMEYDMGYWREWALHIHHHGLNNAYAAGSPINYFPVFVYALKVFDLLQGTEANIIRNINDIKDTLCVFRLSAGCSALCLQAKDTLLQNTLPVS